MPNLNLNTAAAAGAVALEAAEDTNIMSIVDEPAPKFGRNYVQFALGGLSLPPMSQWIRVTERMRGRTVRKLAERLTGNTRNTYASLLPVQRHQVSLIAGKDHLGKALSGHRHAYFLIWPDEHGYPTRLIVWRPEAAFTEMERLALHAAAEKPIPWGGEVAVYVVSLPMPMPLPRAFCDPSCAWRSVTPFVPPAQRHQFRPNGRPRPGEAPERAALRLLLRAGMPEASAVLESGVPAAVVPLHETRLRRIERGRIGGSLARRGFHLRLEFRRPVEGPIILGDSCHFGLGLFRACDERQP